MNIKNENKSVGGDEGDNASGCGGPGWPEACRREETIRKLLGRSEGERLKMGGVEARRGAFHMLDDGHSRTSLPVTAELTSNRWIRIGDADWRQVLSCRFENGTTYFGITPSRLGLAEQQRARRVSEAAQAGRALQTALTKLDAADASRAKMLTHQLQHWLEI